MGDRDLQDEVIRYLTDARLRATPSDALPLPPQEADKAGRFAMFLARRYYRDRMQRSFRYSALFAKQTQRRAEDSVEGDAFAQIARDSVLGSLNAAQRAGQMAAAYLTDWHRQSTVPSYNIGAWWKSLLEYEYLHFLQTATSEVARTTGLPQRGVSAVCNQFEWFMPELLARLREAKPVGDDLRREVTLLFARTHTGKIYVMETDRAAEAVFRAISGNRKLEEIASAAGLGCEDTKRILQSLVEIGAVVA
jgi:hypothetical protein